MPKKKIVDKILGEVVQRDLGRYTRRAIELGATDARLINAGAVIIDERVRAKCSYPKCEFYGTNAHCPPHALPLPEVRALVARYEYSIFIDIRVPAGLIAGTNVIKSGSSVPSALKMYEIVSKVEAEAFYDGYYLALGFACGPCKRFFCPDLPCQALSPGQGCRHPLRSRGSMEGAGMDAYAMATRVGWDVYPIGRSSLPQDVPHGHRLGLILVC